MFYLLAWTGARIVEPQKIKCFWRLKVYVFMKICFWRRLLTQATTFMLTSIVDYSM